MNKRPPEPRPDLDSTRESRGLADVVNARVRAAKAEKESAKPDERSSRTGEARQAALRLSQLVVTSDSELEAFRFTRKLRITSDDLSRARTILDRVNEALLAEPNAAHEILDRLSAGLIAEAPAEASSGRPPSARTTSTRTPSVEVVTAPPVSSPMPPELAWSAEVSAEPPQQIVAMTGADPGEWARIADEETALGAASSGGAVTRQFRPGDEVTAAVVGPVVQLTLEQHAALSAECDTYPHYRAQIEQRYGIVDPAARVAVDQSWHQRLTSDDAMWSRWHSLYASYRESFT